MLSTQILYELGELMLKDASNAFEKRHEYIPSSPDRLSFGYVDISNINGDDLYTFNYVEKTIHDCPNGIELELSETDVVELLNVSEINHNHKVCGFCKEYKKLKDGEYIKNGDLYIDKYGIFYDGDMSRCYSECGKKLQL